MQNKKKQILIFTIVAIALVLIVNFAIGIQLQKRQSELKQEPAVAVTTQALESLSYKGKTGQNALILLQNMAKVEQDESGLVVSINQRKADNAKHEYWAFYVNGKTADIGPAQYQTKDTDLIEWKIEKY